MSEKYAPIIYIYLYNRIKEKNRYIVTTKNLKEIIQRHFLCDMTSGGNRKGIPSIYLYDVIKDLCYLKLLMRLNHIQYRILSSKCEKRLKKFLW